MDNTRKMISLKLPPELLRDIDLYRKKQPVPPTRTAVIEAAVRKMVGKAK
jgi:metal-responsive CopG/Arc/MetJ family transcriptional regulator